MGHIAMADDVQRIWAMEATADDMATLAGPELHMETMVQAGTKVGYLQSAYLKKISINLKNLIYRVRYA